MGRPFSLLRAYGGLTGTRLGTVLGSRRGHHTPAKTKSDDFGGFLVFLEALAVQIHRLGSSVGRTRKMTFLDAQKTPNIFWGRVRVVLAPFWEAFPEYMVSVLGSSESRFGAVLGGVSRIYGLDFGVGWDSFWRRSGRLPPVREARFRGPPGRRDPDSQEDGRTRRRDPDSPEGSGLAGGIGTRRRTAARAKRDPDSPEPSGLARAIRTRGGPQPPPTCRSIPIS